MSKGARRHKVSVIGFLKKIYNNIVNKISLKWLLKVSIIFTRQMEINKNLNNKLTLELTVDQSWPLQLLTIDSLIITHNSMKNVRYVTITKPCDCSQN